MLVLCAPNAFKGTLSAAAASAALARGVRRAGATALEHPVADGGDGTLDVLLAAAGSAARIEVVTVSGPLGDPVAARLGWLDATTAVVEMAEAAGLRLMSERRLEPLKATTYGVGQLIATAIRGGAQRIVVGVGGSATTDGGLGMLRALGADFRDASGAPLVDAAGPGSVASVTVEPVTRLLAGVAIEIAVDVDSPLCGPAGAALMFSPQKGATVEQATALDAALARYATVLEATLDRRGVALQAGAGAAGGTAFALALMGGRLAPGAALVCAITELDAAIRRADVVFTGEGRLDVQTAHGKAPAEVARRARIQGRGCIAIAGEVRDALTSVFAQAHSLSRATNGDATATAQELEDVAARVSNALVDSHAL